MNSVSQEQVLLARPELPYLSNPPSKGYLSFNNTTNSPSTISQVWSTNSFSHHRKVELNLDLKSTKMSWSDEKESPEPAVEEEEEEEETKDYEEESPKTPPQSVEVPEKGENSPAHHARRPMNAFLIFCKKHRPIVRQKFPNLENRGVTRILGEWWAQLDASDKHPYTTLAKEYKDAFLSANPDFKWYKLPAPPLRTLNTRPANIQKPISAIITAAPLITTVSAAARAEFTPGKLADESQLGGLTSLMNMNNGFNINNNNNNNNNNNKEAEKQNNNNIETVDQVFDFSVKSCVEKELPPKPIKKRIFEKYVDSEETATNISDGCEPNMTQQELLNKVVDHMFIQDPDLTDNGKETRKSGRSCKGKRYEQFMVEGKLLSGKREKNQKYFDVRRFDDEFHSKIDTFQNRETLNLDSTIKRLVERTRTDQTKPMEENKSERSRTVSETSDDSFTKNLQNEFNLDLRISNLPSLSYDTYVQRKRESKKRKIRPKSDFHNVKHEKAVNSSPIGSKKRKNKHSITHLEKKTPVIGGGFTSDLFGLATLAEVAANTEKIN